MKEQCDICHQIENIYFTLEYKDFVFGYRLKFCVRCGDKVKEYIVKLTESAVKTT